MFPGGFLGIAKESEDRVVLMVVQRTSLKSFTDTSSPFENKRMRRMLANCTGLLIELGHRCQYIKGSREGNRPQIPCRCHTDLTPQKCLLFPYYFSVRFKPVLPRCM